MSVGKVLLTTLLPVFFPLPRRLNLARAREVVPVQPCCGNGGEQFERVTDRASDARCRGGGLTV
jgi:hypothetical protein